MSRDMMPHFELYQPDTIEGALDLAKRIGPGAWFMAGGNDSLDWFKDRNKRPAAVIEIAGIKTLSGIRETPDGIEIGALTTLAQIERSGLIQEKYALLAKAAGRVASPQIRNSGTLGGNLCQDARCWYYRYGVSCYRAGGNMCYADTPEGMNREHCLFGASRCVAVHGEVLEVVGHHPDHGHPPVAASWPAPRRDRSAAPTSPASLPIAAATTEASVR